MRFQKGEHYPHPPRRRARRPYHVSEAAHRARRRNLSRSQLRSEECPECLQVLDLMVEETRQDQTLIRRTIIKG